MPVDQKTLADNYYVAVVAYLCKYRAYTDIDPATKQRWAFQLQDDACGPLYPQPYIARWDIKSQEEPSPEQLAGEISLAILEACHAALYPQQDSWSLVAPAKSKPLK